MATDHYECHRCGARFGVAGDPVPYTEADYEADEFYDREVEWHESGECSPTAAAVEAETDGTAVVLPAADWAEVVHLLDLLALGKAPAPWRRREAAVLCDRINAQLHGPRLVLAPVLGGDVVRMFPDEVPAGDAS